MWKITLENNASRKLPIEKKLRMFKKGSLVFIQDIRWKVPNDENLQLASPNAFFVKFAIASSGIGKTCFMIKVLSANPGMLLTCSPYGEVVTSDVTDLPMQELYNKVQSIDSITTLFACVRQLV